MAKKKQQDYVPTEDLELGQALYQATMKIREGRQILQLCLPPEDPVKQYDLVAIRHPADIENIDLGIVRDVSRMGGHDRMVLRVDVTTLDMNMDEADREAMEDTYIAYVDYELCPVPLEGHDDKFIAVWQQNTRSGDPVILWTVGNLKDAVAHVQGRIEALEYQAQKEFPGAHLQIPEAIETLALRHALAEAKRFGFDLTKEPVERKA